jgi:hypothetical protein
MFPDFSILTTINNIINEITYKDKLYNGFYKVIITSSNNSNIGAVFDMFKCKSNEKASIFKSYNSQLVAINAEWNENEQIKIYTEGDNNTSYDIIAKFYSY